MPKWRASERSRRQVLEYALWEHATAQVEHEEPGRLSVYVEYRDPRPSTVKMRIRVGDFRGEEIEAFNEDLDQLRELRASCGEVRWAGFMAELQKVFSVVDVLES